MSDQDDGQAQGWTPETSRRWVVERAIRAREAAGHGHVGFRACERCDWTVSALEGQTRANAIYEVHALGHRRPGW